MGLNSHGKTGGLPLFGRLSLPLVLIVLSAGLASAAPAAADTVARVSNAALSSVACESTTTCFAIGSSEYGDSGPGVLVTISNGSVSAPAALPAGFDPFWVACENATTCLVAGSVTVADAPTGAILPITNGAVGSVEQVPGTGDLNGIACGSASSCVAVGQAFSESTDTDTGQVVAITNGVPGSPVPASGTTLLTRAACATASSCLAYGLGASNGDAVVTITNGVPGSPHQIQGIVPNGVGCSSATDCLLVGGMESPQILPVTDGVPAATVQVAAPLASFGGIACSSSGCVTSGSDGSIFLANVKSDGSVGTSQVEHGAFVGESGIAGGVACPSADSCVAVARFQAGGSSASYVISGIPSSWTSTTIGGGGGNPSGPVTVPSSALAVTGQAAKISSILKSGGYPSKVTVTTAGTMTVAWYYVPAGAHLAKAKKPVLIASGKKTFSAAGKATIEVELTSQGRKLLKKSKRIKLTAVGTFAAKHGKTASKRKTITLSH